MNYYLILPLVGGAAGYLLAKDKEAKKRWGLAGLAGGLAAAYLADNYYGAGAEDVVEDGVPVEELPAGGGGDGTSSVAASQESPYASYAANTPWASTASPATTAKGTAGPLITKAPAFKLGMRGSSGLVGKLSKALKAKKKSTTNRATASRFTPASSLSPNLRVTL